MSHVQRYVMPKDELAKYNATPIYKNDDDSRFIRPSKNYDIGDEDEVVSLTKRSTIVGLCIQGWHITSNNSCIANQDETNDVTSTLIDYAKRTLWPPEILFYRAHVTISRIQEENHPHCKQNSTNDGRRNTTKLPTQTATLGQGAMLQLDALSALKEWASAHCKGTNDETGGISILKTKDAPLWEYRRKKQMLKIHQPNQHHPQHNSSCSDKSSPPTKLSSTIQPSTTSHNNSTTTMQNSSYIGEVNFDWTYSTPFTGFFQTPAIRNNTATATTTTRIEHWIPCEKSGIRMDMLMDRNQPILYFDDVILYEDDLHDNGQVQLSIKIRVMPTCFYLLQRLFLRVDRVIVRCRDTRIFHSFDTTTTTTTGGILCYRDVTWREAKWEELLEYHLPNDVPSWRISDGGNTSQILLGKLPLVTLPPNIAPYSYVRLE